MKSDMLAKAANASMANPSPQKVDRNAGGNNTSNAETDKKIKAIEESIKHMNNKFQSELDRMQLM